MYTFAVDQYFSLQHRSLKLHLEFVTNSEQKFTFNRVVAIQQQHAELRAATTAPRCLWHALTRTHLPALRCCRNTQRAAGTPPQPGAIAAGRQATEARECCRIHAG